MSDEKKAGPALDPEAAMVVRRVREGFVRAADTEAILNVSAAQKDDVSLEKNKAELDVLVDDLAQHMTIPVEPVPSPQPLLGVPKTFFKRLVLRLLRPVLNMAMTEQVLWNENAYEAMKRLHQTNERLRQEIDVLNKKVDALRLQKENEKPRA